MGSRTTASKVTGGVKNTKKIHDLNKDYDVDDDKDYDYVCNSNDGNNSMVDDYECGTVLHKLLNDKPDQKTDAEDQANCIGDSIAYFDERISFSGQDFT